MNRRKSVAFAFVGALCAMPSQARADDWLGARSLGRGGTGLADGADAGAVLQNLATSSLAPRYDIVAGGVRGPDDTWLGRVAALDSRTSAIALGATYTYRYDDVPPTGASLPGWVASGDTLDNPTSHQGVSLGLSYPFAGRKLAVAVTGRYDWRDSQNDGQATGFNFGASVAGQPSEAVTLAAGVQNVLDLDYADTRRLVDLGVRWQPGPYLAVEAEARTEWMGDPFADSLGEHVGVDVFPVEWLVLRGGWEHARGQHRVGGGFGLVSKQADLDYGISGEVGEDPLRLWHGLDLRVHF
jgi:hypothetical protein